MQKKLHKIKNTPKETYEKKNEPRNLARKTPGYDSFPP